MSTLFYLSISQRVARNFPSSVHTTFLKQSHTLSFMTFIINSLYKQHNHFIFSYKSASFSYTPSISQDRFKIELTERAVNVCTLIR